MKAKINFTIVGIALVGLAGLMALANPDQKAYQEYATERLSSYLKENVCRRGDKQLENILQTQCKNLVDTARPQLEQLIIKKTVRQNFVLFSIYQTDLSIADPLPSINFESIGGLSHFYVYRIEKS